MSVSSICDCRTEDESVGHILLQCQKYSRIRNAVIIGQIYVSL